MAKTEATLSVQPANDQHGGIVPTLGPPGSVATVAASGSEIEWAPPGTLSIGNTTAAEADSGTLPFVVPFSSSFGVPPGMTYAAVAAVAGDRYLIDGWVQVVDDGGVDRGIEISIQLDDTDVFASNPYPLIGNTAMVVTIRRIYEFTEPNASPVFGIGVHSDGAGPDVTAATLLVTRLPPAE